MRKETKMRIKQAFAAVIALLFVMGTLAPFASAQRKMNIAIVEFEFNTADRGTVRQAYGDVRNLGRQLADSLQNQVVSLGTFTVVERSRVDHVIQELKMAHSGMVDENTAAKAGRMLGADALVLGSISSVEFDGLPKNGYKEKGWKPEYMSVRLGLSFRLVDTSTAQILQAHEVVGAVAPVGKKPSEAEETAKNTGKKWLGRLRLPGIDNPVNRPEEYTGPTPDDFKRIIREASEDAISKMATQLQQADPRSPKPAGVTGRIISVDGKMLFIMDLNPAQVKEGDRLFVRRPREIKDPTTGNTITTSVKIGEVEIMEVQRQNNIMIGTFSGAAAPQTNDIVTDK